MEISGKTDEGTERERETQTNVYSIPLACIYDMYIHIDITHYELVLSTNCTKYCIFKSVNIGKHQEASFVEVDCK